MNPYRFLSLSLVVSTLLAFTPAGWAQQPNSLPEPKVEADTVALWRLGEMHNRFVAQDVVGAPNLVPRGDTMLITDQEVNGRRFFGRERLITEGPRNALPLQRAVTVEVWLRLDAETNFGGTTPFGVFQHIDYPRGGFRVRLTSDGRVQWGILQGTGERFLTTRLELPVERWLHVACTYDGEEAKIYVEGKLEAQMAIPDGVILPEEKPYTVIGCTDPRQFFIGTISAVRVSNTARSFQ